MTTNPREVPGAEVNIWLAHVELAHGSKRTIRNESMKLIRKWRNRTKVVHGDAKQQLRKWIEWLQIATQALNSDATNRQTLLLSLNSLATEIDKYTYYPSGKARTISVLTLCSDFELAAKIAEEIIESLDKLSPFECGRVVQMLTWSLSDTLMDHIDKKHIAGLTASVEWVTNSRDRSSLLRLLNLE